MVKLRIDVMILERPLHDKYVPKDIIKCRHFSWKEVSRSCFSSWECSLDLPIVVGACDLPVPKRDYCKIYSQSPGGKKIRVCGSCRANGHAYSTAYSQIKKIEREIEAALSPVLHSRVVTLDTEDFHGMVVDFSRACATRTEIEEEVIECQVSK